MNGNGQAQLKRQLSRGLYGISCGLFVLLATYSLTVSAQDQAQPQNESPAANETQGFALFEAVETPNNRTALSTRRNNRESRATIAEPEFTLLGTSRIGNKYSVIVRHRNGETIVVQADPDSSTEIPEHSGYSIVNMAAASVSIRYPGGSPCVAFSDRGISCNQAGNTAELALTTAEPLAARVLSQNTPVQAAVRQPGSGTPETDVQGNLVNPFAALRASQDGVTGSNPADANGGNSRFTPRRINPEDVPPGKRVVSTPFGDRLVEQ